jgi:hypothetical protein
MSNRNPLAGIVPRTSREVSGAEVTISQQLEKIEGEVTLDSYVKAQVSAPEVRKRIMELENSLQCLANTVTTSADIDGHPDLLAAVEQAKLILKNRLEVDTAKHRIRTEMGTLQDEVFRDELRILKD